MGICDDEYRFLAHLLGPKAENEEFLIDLLTRVFLDYSHWRQNYFPDDQSLISPSVQRHFEGETDTIRVEVNRMLAGLRRSFPFYSPRYIAHQQSETTIASVIGAFAGTLYNPNNVTPESGAVTVDWEIDACNELLAMLGYRLPPDVPNRHAWLESSNAEKREQVEEYTKRLEQEFGWCHLTSGGTIATIEALWVARAVTYFPLAVADACVANAIELSVKLPDGTSCDVRDLWREKRQRQLLNLKPNEAIFLLARFVAEVQRQRDLSTVEKASALATRWLKKSPYSAQHGIGKAFADFPPAIVTTGAAHYSVEKAADLLGIGRDAVCFVDSTPEFRMDPEKLEQTLARLEMAGKTVIAVVAMVGTTEEGAVDPIDAILALRSRIERTQNRSFWLHVDAAWGGFMRSLFIDDPKAEPAAIARGLLSNRIYDLRMKTSTRQRKTQPQDKPRQSHELDERDESLPDDAVVHVAALDSRPHSAERRWIAEFLERVKEAAEWAPDPAESDSSSGALNNWLLSMTKKFDAYFDDGKYDLILPELQRILTRTRRHTKKAAPGNTFSAAMRVLGLTKFDFEITRIDRIHVVKEFVADTIRLKSRAYDRKIKISWPKDEVGMAFFAMERADSITVDPHKMGYTVYPCGAVAFKNDRVRHFVTQQAPYITSKLHQNVLVHPPPRYAAAMPDDGGVAQVHTDAFAPFTLEGSRPGAAACSLYLASRALPFDRAHHGTLVRSSLLAARALYEWLTRWNEMCEGLSFRFVSYSPEPPDTNIVIFGVKKNAHWSLADYNEDQLEIYNRFSIKSEFGQRDHSYSQPFFLSHTPFQQPHYPYSTVHPFLARAKLEDGRQAYHTNGLMVLRATVMNPYIFPLTESQNLIEEFVRKISTIADAG
jgi:glutamate/tyrosine decarboxylase-like PLP-dependent enzyme